MNGSRLELLRACHTLATVQSITVRELRNLPKVRRLLKEQGAITVTNNGVAEFVLTPPPVAFRIPDFAARIKEDLGGRYLRRDLAAALAEVL